MLWLEKIGQSDREFGFPAGRFRSVLAPCASLDDLFDVSSSVILSAPARQELFDRIGTFPAHDSRRGQEYFRQERVKQIQPLKEIEAEGFRASVQGTRRYAVEWRRTEAGWQNSCNCPLGGDCKHAYASALALLRTTEAAPTDATGEEAAALNTARPARSDPPELEKLNADLEAWHRRVLSTKEKSFVRELVLSWSRFSSGGLLYPRDLRALGIGEAGYYFHDPKPVLEEWRDALQTSTSPLEFWQFLALYAERNKIPIPEVMRPLTDTTKVRVRIAADERHHKIERWKTLFDQTVEEVEAVPVEPMPREIRLRLSTPKLTWEFRNTPDGPWQVAKSVRVKTWFDSAATNTGNLAPASLVLLQEVQLRRVRADVWSSAEAQTLRIDEKHTRELLRWMVQSPLLQPLLVDVRGVPFTPEPQPLRWLGRPVEGQPEDVTFDLVGADGVSAPTDLIDLGGDPAIALSGHAVYQLPAPLAEGAPRGVIVPREALDPRSTARLRRKGVRFEGVELPTVEVIPLRAQFVCTLSGGEEGALEYLDVKLQAVDRDGVSVSVLGETAWSKISIGASKRLNNTIEEHDFSAPETARSLLAALNLDWSTPRQAWTRRASTKTFPEEFASWAESVIAAGAGLVCEGELAGLARPADRAKIEMEAVPTGDDPSEIDWFDLQVAVRAEDHALSEEEVRLLLRARGRFVRLPGKGWRRLQLDLDQNDTSRLAELGLDLTEVTDHPGHQRFHALQLSDERIAGMLPEAHAALIRERVEQLRSIPAPPVPTGLRAELRPYQKEGYHFLVHLAVNGLGGVLADDMGLGKTVQALAWLLWLADRAKTNSAHPLRALVVCPKSVVSNWELETARFAPDLTVAAMRGNGIPTDANLIVVNYAQLRLAAASLVHRPWDAVILDEGQNIKNPQSQTARVARELRAGYRVVLTGTPIENRALDLWSLFAFAMPGLLGSQASFKRSFSDRADTFARARLGRRVRHFMLRRTKSQVAADLPPRIEEDLFVDLDGVQRSLYDAELKRARAMLLGVTSENEFSKQRFNILQSLLRLRQICCDPRLLGIDATDTAAPDEARSSAGSAKLEALFDTVEPLIAEGHRVLVFSQFVSLLKIVASEMDAREMKYLMLTGQTENRQELVDRFQSAEGEPVFLLSLKAAGTGLNLTAASYVVLLDPWWNPAVEAQAIDRTHRIGQKNQVIAYRLLARDTIEEKIRRLQQTKSELARAIVQEDSAATVMSIDDLRFVLGE